MTITAKTTGDTLSIVSGTPQNTTVGTGFTNPLVVAETPTSSATRSPELTVTFSAPGTGATGTFSGGATATTNALGMETSNAFSANTTSGTYNVSASAPGATPTLTFAMTNNAGAATTIAISSGSGQSATVASAFANPLAAKVTDQYGNAVSGVTVTFAPRHGSLWHLHDVRHGADERQRCGHLEHLHGQHDGGWPLQRGGLDNRHQHRRTSRRRTPPRQQATR